MIRKLLILGVNTLTYIPTSFYEYGVMSKRLQPAPITEAPLDLLDHQFGI